MHSPKGTQTNLPSKCFYETNLSWIQARPQGSKPQPSAHFLHSPGKIGIACLCQQWSSLAPYSAWNLILGNTHMTSPYRISIWARFPWHFPLFIYPTIGFVVLEILLTFNFTLWGPNCRKTWLHPLSYKNNFSLLLSQRDISTTETEYFSSCCSSYKFQIYFNL